MKCISFLFCRLLQTVPEDERPPILLSIYADGIDRDQTIHSSGRHKVHCTYIRVLNLCESGCLSRYDYELVQIVHESTLADFGYDRCHEELVSKISEVVTSGIIVNGQKHAVRVAYLQVRFFNCS